MYNVKIKVCPSNNEVISCGNDCISCHKFKLKKNNVNANLQKREISADELIYFVKNVLKIKLSLWQVKLIRIFLKDNK